MRFPVSFSQQRLWFLDQLAPGEPTFHMPYAMWLDGPLDADALQRAMDAMAERHAVLRTSVVAFDGLPEQIVAETGTVVIERVSLPADDVAVAAAVTATDDIAGRAESIATEFAVRPFDLARGPLARAVLIEAAADRHLFVLVMHHIISDGLSQKILIGELSAAYRAETTGVPASLPPHWMEYGDYAVWQHDRLRGEELERQMDYWREQLRGAPTVLTLPTDRPRPTRQSSRGAMTTLAIDAATTRRLAEMAHGANATLFMAFLTGYAVVLSRYARQTDILIGTPVASRTHVELDPIVGVFANTVALRTSLAGDPTFAELLARVRDTTVDALSHQELPFGKLVEELAPDRSLAHAPLIQVQFAYQSLTPPTLDLPGVASRSWALPTGTAKLDLTMYADTSEGDAAALVLEYSTDLFDAPWADRFLRCMAHVLASAADAPDTPVADLPMLSAGEREELIVGRNRPTLFAGNGDGDGRADGRTDIRALLQRSTSHVTCGAESVSMTELCDRAARLARILADHGVGPETPVGLCTDRGISMLTALLGVWWAGGAYVPLDPDFPQPRLAAMAHGADLRVVIADDAHRDLAQSIVDNADVISPDGPAAIAAEPLAPVPLPDEALAYIIFTSGSTGQPKGVGIEHRSVANLLASFRRALGLTADDRFVAVTTLSFDIAVLELLLPLVSGADLVIATADEAREPDRLRALIDDTSATAMQATPQTWRLLLSAGNVPAGSVSEDNVPDSLRLRLCGGEALPRDLAEELMTPDTVLWNLYGPTETTVWSVAGIVTDGPGPVEIGPPIDHTRVYVLDDHLVPVPIGVVGEVFLAGRGVARGYHDRPRLTAQSFRPDPWSDEPGARMYRTGDLGRWLENSGLELVGRTDHQVKIRGFRIECGEIEAVLRTHRDVRQAAVIVAPRAGDPTLVAYIVPRRGSAAAQPGADLLDLFRPHLRDALPDYMLPALIVPLPALPLTPNAKVDRSALPTPDWATGSRLPSSDRVEPRNPVEATLAGIWADLLALRTPIGVHDNLFALGGHSLTATRFVARVADAYGVGLPVHCVFADPTIARLAEIVAADPDFEKTTGPSSHTELDGLSDEDLDALLRAALAQRDRRRATASGAEP